MNILYLSLIFCVEINIEDGLPSTIANNDQPLVSRQVQYQKKNLHSFLIFGMIFFQFCLLSFAIPFMVKELIYGTFTSFLLFFISVGILLSILVLYYPLGLEYYNCNFCL